MLVEHVVRLHRLFLPPQPVHFRTQSCQLGIVRLLLVGQLALVFATLGIVASSQGVGLARLCLQLPLELLGLSLLARLVLL
jgi:hypothetical protein